MTPNLFKKIHFCSGEYQTSLLPKLIYLWWTDLCFDFNGVFSCMSHSNMTSRFRCAWGLSVWRLHVLHVPAWVSSHSPKAWVLDHLVTLSVGVDVRGELCLCLAADMLANYPGCIFVSWPVTAGIDSSPSATLKLDKWLKRWMSGKCFRIYILFPLLFCPEAVNERVDMCVLCAAFFLVLCINKKVLQHMFTVIQQQHPCRKCEDFLFLFFF